MDDKGAAPPVQRFVIQVNPGRPRFGVDLTLCKKDLLPDARNQKIEFTARIYAFKGGKWEYPGENRRIAFSFIDDKGKKTISKEWGVCMNYPIRNKNNITPASAIESNQNPDLFFPDDDPQMNGFNLEEDDTSGDPCPTEILAANDNPVHHHHYLKATTKDAVTEATVVVRCEDYGAFGILQVEAEDCETLKPRESNGECSGEIGPNEVKIPRDDNENFIADGAAQDKLKDGTKAPADEDNDDTPVTDGYPGDGLTNYEEYRGFIVTEGGTKKHIRTDITKKDIFIYDKDGLTTGFFNQSDLTINFISEPCYFNGDSSDQDAPPDAGTQVINFNRGHATGGEQHGLRLVNFNSGGGLYGYTYGGGPGLPRVTNRVAIDRAVCTGAGEHANALSATTAHELGHSVNVFHHGQLPDHNHGGVDTDPTGGVTSGDASCVMRYDNYRTQWCHPNAPPPGCHIHPIPLPEAPGTTYCSSPNATGINVIKNHFNNNASVGNCKSHIRVKDW